MQKDYFGYELCGVFQSSFKWSRSVHTLDAYTYIQTSTCYPHLHFLLFCILKSVIYA